VGVSADAEALRDHHPGAEAPPPEEILAGAAHSGTDDEADAQNDDEVKDQDGPVEERDGHDVTRRTDSAHPSASQFRVTVPAGVMPRYAAGMLEAIGTISSSDRPVNQIGRAHV